MIVAVFGATGGTGRHVVEQALAQGHTIRALVRDPARLAGLAAGNEALILIPGDVREPQPVADCVQGSEAVICVLGTRGAATPVEAAGTAQILAAMQAQGVRRLIAVTSMGVGDSIGQVPAFFRVLMRLTLKQIMAAKEEQETLIRASGLDWTIVRPGGLTDGAPTGQYQSGTDRAIKATRVARADVAEFVVRQLNDQQYLHQTPAIS
ncbi:MAG: NAD(P)-dependent oxidoreductase [Chromatiaceae bacterium]|nr:MAG: NAD(P)-dependent oxidoreductase [Chromatiaceae bacterium]